MFSLNVHASYACRHSGACCNAGWSIPVEPPKRRLLGTDWLVAGADGACPEHDRGSGLCRVHRDHGEAMLPESCRQFPRRALTDSRGTRVTLSHYCPTAAAMLVDSEGPLAVVASPPAFPATGRFTGLDATDQWPPLLRPNALFDASSFAAWERYLIDTLGSSKDDVPATLVRIAARAERLRQWNDGDGSLLDWTTSTLNASHATEAEAEAAAAHYSPFAGSVAFVRAAATVPAGLVAPAMPEDFDEGDARWVAPVWTVRAPLVLRYLGAHTFASWTPYQSRGIRVQIAELFVTAAVLRVECVRACQVAGRGLARDTFIEAVRASDMLLVHLADRDGLMAWVGEAENHARP